MEPFFSYECPINNEASSAVRFHNFHHQDSEIDFPYRGFIWFKRFSTLGEEISISPNHILKSQNCKWQQYSKLWDGEYLAGIFG